ncbi:unnamed protein product [Cunninghamella blakesleeana]
MIDNKCKYHDKLKNCTAPQRILSYDLLSLLLELSDSPLKQHYKNTQSNIEKNKKTIENWNDVLNEEPLEGSHWQQWDDFESDEDSIENKNDEFEMDSTYESNKRKKKKSSSVDDYNKTYWEDDNNDYYLQRLQQNDKFKSDKSTHFILNQLHSKQYWHKHSPNNGNEELNINSSILQKPCQLNEALHNYNNINSSTREYYYIKESYAIREVLFFLRGYETVIFKRSEGNHSSTISSVFYVNGNYHIKHLSNNAFNSLMNTFCKYGNVLYRLRRHIKRTVFVRKNGQTYQAFSAAISSALNDFEFLIAKLEIRYATITTPGSKEMHSLLQLHEELQLPLSCLSAIHDTLLQCSNLVSSNPQSNSTDARTMSVLLLSIIFNQIVDAEISGNDHIYSTMCTIFKQTLAPFSRLMDEWIFHGTLENDIANEFLITSNMKLLNYSPQYWSDGFNVNTPLTNTDLCPLFLPNFANTILFIGKAVNLCKHIDQTFSITHNEYPSLEYIFSQFPIKSQMPFISDCKNKDAILADSTMKDIDDGTVNSFIEFGVPKINTQQSYKSVVTIQDYFMNTLFNHDFEECLEQYIKKPYEDSATLLISVLQKNNGLFHHLEILTIIYFMLESNLMHSFCETIFIQMDKKENWYDRIFLNQAFNDSCKLMNSQSYMESMKTIDIKMKLDKNDLNQPRKTSFPAGFKAITTATYLDQLIIDYEIPWPINNFIKPDCMKYYDKVMHFLLRIKRSKHVLEKKILITKQDGQYTALHTTKSSTSNNIVNNTTRLYILRMQMIWFVNSFWRYIMTTVIHADTIAFKEKVSNLNDIDKITILHDQYIMGIIDKSLLNDKSVSIKKAIVHIFDMVEQLAVLFNQSSIERIDEPLNVLEQEYKRTSDFISTSIAVMKRQVNLNWFDVLSTSLST